MDISQYTAFIVTGKTVRGKRFRLQYSNQRVPGTLSGAFMAFGINLLAGSVWGVLPTGKRKLLKRV